MGDAYIFSPLLLRDAWTPAMDSMSWPADGDSKDWEPEGEERYGGKASAVGPQQAPHQHVLMMCSSTHFLAFLNATPQRNAELFAQDQLRGTSKSGPFFTLLFRR